MADWAAWDGLDLSNYFSIANPNGSRGTVDVGNVHLQMWATIETQAVTSDFRIVFSTQEVSTPYGYQLMVYGTNQVISFISRGSAGDWSIESDVDPATMVGAPVHIVGAIDNSTMKLWVNGVRISPDQPLPTTGRYTVPTQPIALGKRPSATSGDNAGDVIRVHGFSTGNTGAISDSDVTAAYTAALAAKDIVAITGKTDHLYSAKQETNATQLTDRVGSQTFTKTGTPTFVPQDVAMTASTGSLAGLTATGTINSGTSPNWAAIDGLDDTDYYILHNPNGSRGQNDLGNVHIQAWITIESQGVSSNYRFIYSTEDNALPYGYTIFTYGTNTTLVMHSRGPSGDWSNEYDIPPELVGTPVHVTGVIRDGGAGVGVIELYVNGSKVVIDQTLPATGRYGVPVNDIAIGCRPNGTGNGLLGDIRVHGIATGNNTPSASEILTAYLAGLSALDIVAIPGKSEHLWSAYQEGSAAAQLTDRIGAQNFTRVGSPTYVSSSITVNGAAPVLAPLSASGTVSLAMDASGTASLDGLTATGAVLVGIDVSGSVAIDAALSAYGVVSVTAGDGTGTLSVYAQRGTTFTGEFGEAITEAGTTVGRSEFTRNKLMLGYIRTDSPGNYPVIDQQTISSQGSASLAGLTASGSCSVGVIVSGDASLAALTASGAITNSFIDCAGNATLAGLTASGAISTATATQLEPFAAGSHWNEYQKYATLKAGGVSWIRVDASWDEAEPTQGSYDFGKYDTAFNEAQLRGLKVLCILGYSANWASTNPGDSNPKNWAFKQQYESNWTAYITAFVNRYQDRIAAWELWNEADHDNFLKIGAGGSWAENTYPGETAVNKKRLQYKRMIDLAIGTGVFNGKVLTTTGFAQGGGYDTGFVDWLRTQTSGGLSWLRQFSVANYHAYGYSSYQRLIDQPAYWNNTGSLIGATWKHWITEHGITTTGVSDANVKQYLIRSYVTALSQPNVERLFWFRAGYDPDHMDLFDASSNTTAAYAALQLLANQWSAVTSVASYQNGGARGGIATRQSQPRMAVLWADSGGAPINSYGLNITTVWNQDGGTISSSTTLGANPVFVQLSD